MKKRRQELIARFIENNSVGTQDELIDMLLKEGINVTQATVSRDIKEMRIVKRPAATGGYKYCMPSEPSADIERNYSAIFVGAAIGTDCAGNIVVVKCHIGAAQAACAALDSISMPDVVGTIAGDDTIFILCRTPESALNIKKELDLVFGF